MTETTNRLKAMWHCLLGHKVIYRATPRVIIHDQGGFTDIMTRKIELIDTHIMLTPGVYFLGAGDYQIENSIILGDGASIQGRGKYDESSIQWGSHG